MASYEATDIKCPQCAETTLDVEAAGGDRRLYCAGCDRRFAHVFDAESGEAFGFCAACGKAAVETDSFGRDNCVKIVDETLQTPEVLKVFCTTRCLWDFVRRHVKAAAKRAEPARCEALPRPRS